MAPQGGNPNFGDYTSFLSGLRSTTSTGAASTSSPAVMSTTTPINAANSNSVTSGPNAFSETAVPSVGLPLYPDPNHHGDDGQSPSQQPPGHPPRIFAAAGAVATVLFMAVVFAIFCFLCRRRKRGQSRRTAAGAAVPSHEMAKTVAEHRVSLSSSQPYLQPPTSPPPAMTIAEVGSPSSHSLPSSAPTGPNRSDPVILTTAMDQNYYTGIDTSDHISLADNRSSRLSSEGYADSTDEPPPPYRPASVPPISRETSLRIASGLNTLQLQHQHTQVLARDGSVVRSPFDDPIPGYQSGGVSPVDEEEAEAPGAFFSRRDASTIPRRDLDRMSDVSDLSYQEPVIGHSTV